MPQGDVNPRLFRRDVIFCPWNIREATVNDLPFIMQLGKEMYPARDVEKSRQWARWCILDANHYVLVGPNSMGCAELFWSYGCECKARSAVLAARPVAGAVFETLRILRMMITWAKQRGAIGTFTLDADTGIDFLLFAKRLGGKSVTKTHYELPIS